jgi:hypothetical protein
VKLIIRKNADDKEIKPKNRLIRLDPFSKLITPLDQNNIIILFGRNDMTKYPSRK